MTSTAKLTALSSQTMALLLDREKGRRVDDQRIRRNLAVLRGVKEPGLKRQYEVMRAMFGEEQDDDIHEPYTDDPTPPLPPLPPPDVNLDLEAGRAHMHEGELFEEQQQIMQEQDTHLDTLAQSISRQHHISTQINGELEEHVGLLEALEEDVDNTHNRMATARRRLDRVVKGVGGNVSTVTIGVLILILLVLIVVFKT
ncbi:hypothetical protein BDZ89DRAFT_1112858 [Hymenopellis radicata]|nr:hypothetical protein BDZ89DRAFT_1112858 [Hymenopellis radicata]